MSSLPATTRTAFSSGGESSGRIQVHTTLKIEALFVCCLPIIFPYFQEFFFLTASSLFIYSSSFCPFCFRFLFRNCFLSALFLLPSAFPVSARCRFCSQSFPHNSHTYSAPIRQPDGFIQTGLSSLHLKSASTYPGYFSAKISAILRRR